MGAPFCTKFFPSCPRDNLLNVDFTAYDISRNRILKELMESLKLDALVSSVVQVHEDRSMAL